MSHKNFFLYVIKPLNSPNLLIPYKQYYIQTLYREGRLIPEQTPGEINPLFQMVINPNPFIPHEQTSCASACNPTTSNLQHTPNQRMCNLKFTIT